jgi:mannose-1-phosphate guanylyltransferase
MSVYSGIILAGGDGTRLASLTRRLAGDERPKQFCRLIGDDTLLEQTRRRARLLIAPERLLTVVTRHHERFYWPALADAPPRSTVVQPENRGTAPAVLYAVSRLAAMAPEDPVVMLPSDHRVSDDTAFMVRVECALEAVDARPDVVVLLGIAPDRAEVEYGWIEPAELIRGRWAWPIYRVRRFWEKPSRPIAERLEAAGCLWNCFVVVARPSTLEQLIRGATPELHAAFAPLRARLDTPREEDTARAVYRRLPSTDLSRHVFQASAERLAVLPVSGVGWTDLGDPARVHEAQARLGGQPATAR